VSATGGAAEGVPDGLGVGDVVAEGVPDGLGVGDVVTGGVRRSVWVSAQVTTPPAMASTATPAATICRYVRRMPRRRTASAEAKPPGGF
jgi:hypothetical protein